MPPDASAVREFDGRSFADREIFRRTIAEHAQPAVVRGAVRHWPVVRLANESAEALCDYLRKFACDALAEAFIGDSAIAGRYTYADDLEGFNFERVKVTLSDALARISANAAVADGPTMYVGSLQTSIFLPGFAAENGLAAVPKSVDARIWIGNRSDISCHNDTFDNIACVVSGRRRFTLYPPDAVADLYVGPVDYTMSGRPISLAAGAPADDPCYPRFPAAAARATSVELAPGDALYLPKLWWHRVEAADAFNVGLFDRRRRVGALGHIAVVFGRPDQRQPSRTVFLHQPSDDGNVSFTIGTPMRPEKQQNRLATQAGDGRRLGAEPYGRVQLWRGLAFQAQQVDILLDSLLLRGPGVSFELGS